jgi:hypothetical protein
MERKEPATTDVDAERAAVRARFRRKLAAAEARMTPEKRAKVREIFGLNSSAA